MTEQNGGHKSLSSLRFATTRSGMAQTVSLAVYKRRMLPKQRAIYYLLAESYSIAAANPCLEVFRNKGVEVLFLTDPAYMWELPCYYYQATPLCDVTRGELRGPSVLVSESELVAQQVAARDFEDVCQRIDRELGSEIIAVRVSNRLVHSAACLVVSELDDMGMAERRVYEEAGQPNVGRFPMRELEINPKHSLLRWLKQIRDDELVRDLIWVIYEHARLGSGEALKEAQAYLQRIERVFETFAVR